MASSSVTCTAKLFAAFAALDLAVLLALSREAVREASEADPAGLLRVFGAMQAAAVCGLLLLTLWLLAAAVRASIQSGLRWCRHHISSRETPHVEA
ncbi:MAG: hypothetical protein JF595_10460 [Sphingomonadales bacterium]|nr:hypothetical protein [Sphingomonadales bacterium]